MIRLLLCAFLGSSLLVVQAHVVRRRLASQERAGEAVVRVHHVAKRRREEQSGGRLGGGTTRTLDGAEDTRLPATAHARLPGRMALPVTESDVRPPVPAAGLTGSTAPPILRI